MKIFLNKRLTLDNTDWVADAPDMENLLDELIEILKELKFYPDFMLCYSRAEFLRLIDNIGGLAAIHGHHLTNKLDLLRTQIFLLPAVNIDNSEFIRGDTRYFYWDLDTISTNEISNSVLAAAAECEFSTDERLLIINLSVSEFCRRNIIPVIRDFHQQITPVLVNLDWMIDATNIQARTMALRGNRPFFLSPKHGENGVGNWQGESVLYCSAGEAANYLNLGLGLIGEDCVYYYDEPRGIFLKFRTGGDVPGAYHGFHIEVQDEQIQIPNYIRIRLRDN